MTSLSTHPVEEPDLLSLIGDTWTSTRKPFADAFREACRLEADTHMGWVNPNRVRAKLLDHPQYNPRQLSGLWSTSCATDGFLVKTDRLVQIAGEGSKGNGNKSVPLRRWRGWVS
jgi:hypothetical protein